MGWGRFLHIGNNDSKQMETLCGYTLNDVRKTLASSIDKREIRAAQRWTAELVATPGAVGSLWASYWIAWAASQGAGGATPTLPILLAQTWERIREQAFRYDGDWVGFRNDADVRALAAEMTLRLIQQPRRTPVIWPKKEIVLHDMERIMNGHPPAETDSLTVTRVWRRGADSMDLRILAGHWIVALRTGDLRTVLSVVAWSLMSPAQQGISKPIVCAERGPAELPAKARASPVWFWLELGRVILFERDGLHKGWISMQGATTEAFKLHYRRWSAGERMRVLLAWILQVYSSCQSAEQTGLWDVPTVRQTIHEIDLPYKEIAAELADPNQSVIATPSTADTRKGAGAAATEKERAKMAAESKMAEADAAVLAAFGITED